MVDPINLVVIKWVGLNTEKDRKEPKRTEKDRKGTEKDRKGTEKDALVYYLPKRRRKDRR